MLYFRVSSSWMKSSGYNEGESKVFTVIRVEDTVGGNGGIVVLLNPRAPDGQWPVFKFRGYFVPPYTLILIDGLFSPAVADVEARGSDIITTSQYETFEEAQHAAIRLNKAIRKAVADSIPKLLIEDVLVGSFVRRVGRDGMPMAKTYRRDGYDVACQRFPLVDPRHADKTFMAPVGTYVVIDRDD